ncbi:MAG: hypothetical protein ACXW0L_05950 [Methylosarcina sp.]
MKNMGHFLLLLMLLLSTGVTSVYGDASHLKSCQSFYGRLHDLKLQRPPRHVLLVPLLSRDPHTNESPRWSEQPARTVKAFYRKRFKASVTQLRDIWSWPDYYRQVDQLIRISPPFDRLIFISHGGFDGPVLKNAVYWQDHEVVEGKGKLVQYSEAQPGLKNVLNITYDPSKNDQFSDFMNLRHREFAQMKTNEIRQLLKGMEQRLQPLDQSCFQTYCAPNKLAGSPEEVRRQRLDICEVVCREPLFELKTSVEISEERFFRFTNTLKSLVAPDGLIFFGSCNPGSAVPLEKMVEKDETELLIQSSLADGPYKSYVHLVSAATGRISAGPIGQSSAEDIINRLVLFESDRSQRYLCIVTPETL